MAVNGDPGSPALRLHLEQYYLASPISNAPVESLLQLLKHGGGRYMELPALLQLMSLRTCKEAIKTVDVHELQQHMGQLRAEVRLKEDAAAAAQRSAKAERQITEAAHKVGRVVVNVGDHACQEQLAAAHALAFGGQDFGHTTVEEAMKMTGKQLQSYLQFHKQEREAPAANKSRAAKQGETTPTTTPSTLFKRSRAAGATQNSVAKRARAARLACGEIA
ncbi:hypothetical protein HaLaN_25892 [Haematococcus lacustris]|uniref:Uncharacterized protein n=1 Tax=Haematococcus lacustris TaxID=44745 RepID=A0A6A0A560_HAELA|nr:hypothetical protein HaLaN_25892 [Haematococcus lacustris]